MVLLPGAKGNTRRAAPQAQQAASCTRHLTHVWQPAHRLPQEHKAKVEKPSGMCTRRYQERQSRQSAAGTAHLQAQLIKALAGHAQYSEVPAVPLQYHAAHGMEGLHSAHSMQPGQPWGGEAAARSSGTATRGAGVPFTRVPAAAGHAAAAASPLVDFRLRDRQLVARCKRLDLRGWRRQCSQMSMDGAMHAPAGRLR